MFKWLRKLRKRGGKGVAPGESPQPANLAESTLAPASEPRAPETKKGIKGKLTGSWLLKWLFIAFLLAGAVVVTTILMISHFDPKSADWQAILAILSLLLLGVMVSRFWGVKKEEAKLNTFLDEFHELKHTFRRKKDEELYDENRSALLAAKIHYSSVMAKDDRTSEEEQAAYKKLEEAEAKFKVSFDKVNPCRKGDKDKKIRGFVTIKQDIYKTETDLVTKHSIPFVIFAILAGACLLLFAISLLSDSDASKPWIKSIFLILGLAALIYVGLSFETVGPSECAVKLFLGRAYAEVGSGPRLVWRGLVRLVKFPTVLQRYDLHEENIILARAKQEQPITVDTSAFYHYERLRDIILELGTNVNWIRNFLEGDPNLRGAERSAADRGVIGDVILAFTRSFVAERMENLNQALKMQENLSDQLIDILRDDYEYLGIRFDKVPVTSVKPGDEIVSAFTARAKAEVEKETAAQTAEKVKREAGGQAEAAKMKGQAEADVQAVKGVAAASAAQALGEAQAVVREKMGNAEAAALLAQLQSRITALSDLSTKEKLEAAMPALTLLLMGGNTIEKIAASLKEFKIIALPEVSQVLAPILSAVGLGKAQSGRS